MDEKSYHDKLQSQMCLTSCFLGVVVVQEYMLIVLLSFLLHF